MVLATACLMHIATLPDGSTVETSSSPAAPLVVTRPYEVVLTVAGELEQKLHAKDTMSDNGTGLKTMLLHITKECVEIGTRPGKTEWLCTLMCTNGTCQSPPCTRMRTINEHDERL